MVKNKKFDMGKKAVANPFAKMIAGMRNLLVNSKSKTASMLAKSVLMTVPFMIMIGCDKPSTCTDYTDPNCPTYDPERVRIEGLQADSVALLDSMRLSIPVTREAVASYGPNAQNVFDGNFVAGRDEYDSGNQQTDTAGGCNKVYNAFEYNCNTFGYEIIPELIKMNNFANEFKQKTIELADERSN